ncbi:PHA/PHB synthase family protein [Terasakiella pusilla]|uniref:PHA/PHB synthase family protein n=1 Tax=Terasakiella pusilla TaxID=64973 RepID=UPI00048F2DDB|nr:alpha/beta fold hydrolase [Terasakiella pusilla]
MTKMSVPNVKNSIDRAIHALEGRMTNGLSPASIMVAYFDWLVHMAHSPGKVSEMSENFARKTLDFNVWAARATMDPEIADFIQPLPEDRRFRAEEWKQFPFNVIAQGFLLKEQWWHYATMGIPGVSKHHESMVSFGARQWLDIISPTNFFATNPQVLKTTMEQGGQNLVKGAENFWNEVMHNITNDHHDSDSKYKVGENIACTKGKVVYRNRLVELLQYEPTTKKVEAEPILIVPAWIMKYYILDLSQYNSLVKFLVDKGHTVFMISWHNPTAEDRDLNMEDYVQHGVMDSLDAISAIVPDQKIHGVGYCLGGTLLTIAAAAMARDNDERFKTVSLFTTQTDFSEAGELMLFIDESQISYMEDMMWDQGYLDTKQMSGAFQLLRSFDLIWSKMVSEYLLGEKPRVNDLMSWNADATRMPYKMHTEYLRRLFLNNDLAAGRFEVGGKPISVSDIRTPIFAVATGKDHVAPWKSVYKIHQLVDTDVTFVLTNGGHNAGIVNEPGHPRRHYQIATKLDNDRFVPPMEWAEKQPVHEGSWWEPWQEWIKSNSSKQVAPPIMGTPEGDYQPICDAPGTYVFEE